MRLHCRGKVRLNVNEISKVHILGAWWTDGLAANFDKTSSHLVGGLRLHNCAFMKYHSAELAPSGKPVAPLRPLIAVHTWQQESLLLEHSKKLNVATGSTLDWRLYGALICEAQSSNPR